MKKFLPIILIILLVILAFKFIYIRIGTNYPVIGAGPTLRNIWGDQIKCPLNPMVEKASACYFCLESICIGTK